jgi:uncharacterized protein YdhG (YjbR/CyaY superfamily)
MAKTSFSSVDEFLASQPEEVRTILVRVRRTICQAVPEAQEIISYNMPTYTLHGDRMVQFSVWKHHYSLYGATQQLMESFSEELRSYQIDKGTIRFPLSQPVPVELIRRIAKFRAQEVTAREPVKRVASKKK